MSGEEPKNPPPLVGGVPPGEPEFEEIREQVGVL